MSLRYFNVAGAHRRPAGGWLGERHGPETHLIPNVLAAAAAGRAVEIFGSDYPTPDGTCVRDYIHVTDLGRAHLLALAAATPGVHRVYNLGSGTGYSNSQVLDSCREVTGADIPARMAGRRPGDPPVLIASSARIQADLGWQPERDLTRMVTDAWTCARARTDG